VNDSLFDPCVFIDDDGTVYFYNGGNGRMIGGVLKDSMVEVDGDMRPMEGLDQFHEGPWVFKKDGIYYGVLLVVANIVVIILLLLFIHKYYYLLLFVLIIIVFRYLLLFILKICYY
jgi:hypothetical protein